VRVLLSRNVSYDAFPDVDFDLSLEVDLPSVPFISSRVDGVPVVRVLFSTGDDPVLCILKDRILPIAVYSPEEACDWVELMVRDKWVVDGPCLREVFGIWMGRCGEMT
jgi:hypothetical protein